MLGIDIKRLRPEATIPEQAKASDAGYDLCSVVSYELAPHERAVFETGIAVAIPEGYVGYVKPRSGLAIRQGLDVLAGVIDSGYRGEIGVVLYNTDPYDEISISAGDRIAQLVIQPVMDVEWREVIELMPSERSFGGFGSTGV